MLPVPFLTSRYVRIVPLRVFHVIGVHVGGFGRRVVFRAKVQPEAEGGGIIGVADGGFAVLLIQLLGEGQVLTRVRIHRIHIIHPRAVPGGVIADAIILAAVIPGNGRAGK